MAEGALREVIAQFGVEIDEAPLAKFEESIEHFKAGIERVGERMVEVFALHELKEFVMGTVEAGAKLQDMSLRLGISTDALQKFQFAAQLGGVDAEAAAHSLGLFTRQLGETSGKGSSAAKTLKEMGVHYKDAGGKMRPTLDILGDVADKIKETDDPAKRAAIAMRLFGRAGLGMVPVLSEGREGLEGLYKEFDELGGGMSGDFVKSAKAADDEIVKLKLSWTSLKSRIVSEVLPSLSKLLDWMKSGVKHLIQVSEKTRLFHDAWNFGKILLVVGALQKIVPVLMSIVRGTGLLGAMNPFTLMVVGALALFLIFNDFMTLMRGGNSVIGEALGPDKKQFVDDMTESFQALKDLWVDLKDAGGEIFSNLMATLPTLIKGLGYIIKAIAWILGKAEDVGTFFQKLKGGGVLDEMQSRLEGKTEADIQMGATPGNNAEDARTKAISQAWKAQQASHYYQATQSATMPQAPWISAAARAQDNGGQITVPTTTITNNNTITVQHNNSDSPEHVGKAIGHGLTKQQKLDYQAALAAAKKT